MAKVIKKSRGLSSKYRLSQIVTLGAFGHFALLCAVAAYVLGVLKIFSLPVLSVIAGLMVFWVCIGLYFKRRWGILKAGVEGEKMTAKVVSDLPKNYTVVRNAVIRHEGKSSELDLIVFSERGVVVIEAKNYKGVISGDVSDKNWEKTKRNGNNSYTKKFYNPVKQIGTQIHRLSGYLRDNGIDTFVEGAVYFADDEAALNITGSKRGIEVISLADGKDALNDYIESRKKTLSESDVAKIEALFS